MEEQSLPAISPQPKKSRTVLILIVATSSLVLVFVGIFIYFLQLVGPSALAPQHRLNQNEIITLLTQKSSLTFSTPVFSSPATLESLPDYSKYLIFPGAISASIERASFQNGNQGFVINYKKPGNLQDIYRAFATSVSVDLKVVYGSRTNDIAFVDLAGSPSKARIILISDGRNVNVNITIINL